MEGSFHSGLFRLALLRLFLVVEGNKCLLDRLEKRWDYYLSIIFERHSSDHSVGEYIINSIIFYNLVIFLK